jgi:hypothetical protein
VCRLPSRIRIPLHIGSLTAAVAGVLEICPGCGTGHDRPAVTATSTPLPRVNPVVRIAHGVHAWWCRRRGVKPLGCAHGACPWPGRYGHVHVMAGDEGTWRYVFCSRRHRRAWAIEHRIRLT